MILLFLKRLSLNSGALLVLALSLSACSSLTADQKLAAAKIDFQQQDYSRAFKRLVLLAQTGDANAQYAVGYQYYYGLGVLEDPQSARYWMNKAAQNGSLKARQALEIQAVNP